MRALDDFYEKNYPEFVALRTKVSEESLERWGPRTPRPMECLRCLFSIKYLRNGSRAHERIIEVHTVLPLIYQAIWKLVICDLICYIHL